MPDRMIRINPLLSKICGTHDASRCGSSWAWSLPGFRRNGAHRGHSDYAVTGLELKLRVSSDVPTVGSAKPNPAVARSGRQHGSR